MRDDFLIFGSPQIGEAELDEVRQVMESGWLGTGPRVERFEKAFAAYKKEEYAAAVSSCTAALHLSLLVAGLEQGDEVITSPMTFCATVNAIIHAGATPVLADINPATMNLCPAAVEAAITSRTKAILLVHFAGYPCDMDAFCAIADKYNLILIEDCAHAIETLYKGKHAGTFGDFGCFSFYVTKNIVTGEGGMILSRNEKQINQARIMALHGMSKDAWKRFSDEGYKHYDVVDCGFKYNMMDLQAAIGIHQLERVEEGWNRRHIIWNRYNEGLSNLPLILPTLPIETNSRHAYHLYTILVDENKTGISRDKFLMAMTNEKIGTGVHYRSIPEHPYYQDKYGWKAEAWPNAMSVGQQTVSLPLSAKLSDNDVDDVIKAIHRVLNIKVKN
jgi:dTDP-4-amino-4,6-dideoxygalactose transaminase